jgi:hypothetical protein
VGATFPFSPLSWSLGPLAPGLFGVGERGKHLRLIIASVALLCILGAARILVNYNKDGIKARKRLRYYLVDVLQAFVLDAHSRLRLSEGFLKVWQKRR